MASPVTTRPFPSPTRIGNLLQAPQQTPRVSGIHNKTAEKSRAKRASHLSLLRWLLVNRFNFPGTLGGRFLDGTLGFIGQLSAVIKSEYQRLEADCFELPSISSPSAKSSRPPLNLELLTLQSSFYKSWDLLI